MQAKISQFLICIEINTCIICEHLCLVVVVFCLVSSLRGGGEREKEKKVGSR